MPIRRPPAPVQVASAAGPVPPWLTVSAGRAPGRDPGVVSTRRVLLQVGAIALLVIALVAAGSVVLARQVAEREAVNAAAQATDLLAEAVVQSALDDGLVTQDPAARAEFDAVVRERVLRAPGLLRVKLWNPQGVIVYSDEPRLVGRRFALGEDEQHVLLAPRTEADVTDLTAPENEYERGQGKLLEVYRPVWTPSGKALLFETYTRYSAVTTRTAQLWRGFAGVLVSSLLLLVVLLLPLLWALLDRLRRSQRHREDLLQDAVDASTRERRRIAATLHDGVVQELVATSFTITAAAEQSEASGRSAPAQQLRAAAGAVRAAIGGLRSLLVDIYPPSLRTAGLPAALTDLAATVRARDIALQLELPPVGVPTGLDAEGEQLVFRVAQETLRNAVAHSGASAIALRLELGGEDVVLEVRDDGIGFDPAALRTAGSDGHFGLRLLPDLVEHAGAVLRLSTAPGAGTRWLLEVPRR